MLDDHAACRLVLSRPIASVALIESIHGAILDGNLFDGPITPVAAALWTLRSDSCVYGRRTSSKLEAIHPNTGLPKPYRTTSLSGHRRTSQNDRAEPWR